MGAVSIAAAVPILGLLRYPTAVIYGRLVHGDPAEGAGLGGRIFHTVLGSVLLQAGVRMGYVNPSASPWRIVMGGAAYAGIRFASSLCLPEPRPKPSAPAKAGAKRDDGFLDGIFGTATRRGGSVNPSADAAFILTTVVLIGFGFMAFAPFLILGGLVLGGASDAISASCLVIQAAFLRP